VCGALAAFDFMSWLFAGVNAWLAVMVLKQARLQNKALQLTKPAQAMELRS
jgi:hypothetical protein